jgi:hypothetical protein
VRSPGPALDRRRIRDEVAGFLGGRDTLNRYEREVRESGLMEHLLEKGREHHEAVAASGHSLGAIGYTEGAYLYALLRAVRPKVVVETGWLIPPRLKEQWTLILGRSQEELPPLLERLGTVDTFMHDSEHSFDCMWFEFNAAWPALRPGGMLVSDDVNSTEAFGRFAAQERRKPVRLARGMALLQK